MGVQKGEEVGGVSRRWAEPNVGVVLEKEKDIVEKPVDKGGLGAHRVFAHCSAPQGGTFPPPLSILWLHIVTLESPTSPNSSSM